MLNNLFRNYFKILDNQRVITMKNDRIKLYEEYAAKLEDSNHNWRYQVRSMASACQSFVHAYKENQNLDSEVTRLKKALKCEGYDVDAPENQKKCACMDEDDDE